MSRSLILRTAASALRTHRLDYLIFFVTSRCNARCRMCFNYRVLDKYNGRDDLSLEEIEKIADRIPRLLQLTLSGGEPFLRDDLFEIVGAFARKSQLGQLTLTTNGLAPDRVEALFSKIVKNFPELSINFDISLDAVGAAHDAIRGVDGAYDRAVETWRRVQSLKGRYRNFRLGVTAVLSSFNLDEIFPLLEKLDSEFVLDRCEVMLARGQTREPSAVDVPLERFEKVHEWLNEHNHDLAHSLTGRFLYQLSRRKREIEIQTAKEDRMILPCVAGTKMAVLDADGTVRPCEIIHTLYPDKDLTLGALRSADYDLPGIMNSEKARNVGDFIRRTQCYCTFECAILAGLVFQPRQWPRLGVRALGGVRHIW